MGPVLVVGGTGLLGAPVVEALQARGEDVRVLARNPAATLARSPKVEAIAGDVLDASVVDRAVQGCDAVHISLRGRTIEDMQRTEVGGARVVAEAAARAGVGRVSLISGSGIEERLGHHPFVRAKLDAEAALKAAGVAWTILRPTHFMESLPSFVRGARADVLGRQPHRLHYLAAADYADIAVRALREDAAANRSFNLLGPEAFTMREALERYVAACRPGVKVGQAPLPVLNVVAAVTRSADLRHVVRLFSAFAEIGEDPDGSAADALFGPAPTSLAAWCAERGVAAAA